MPATSRCSCRGRIAASMNVNGTVCENDHHQRDNGSDQRHCRSYPEHSALSVKHEPSLSGSVRKPSWHACRFQGLPSRDADDDRS